jgi:hypothetical protein
MRRAEDLDRFRALLKQATSAVGRDYFLLPLADAEGGEPLIQHRERVYAYELYHRLRCLWPEWSYSLGGEVDKRGYPLVRGADLDNVKPDLLVHVPGVMNQNLVVVEIKAASPSPPADERTAIEKDLRKLAAFCSGKVGYHVGFLLVFGEEICRIQKHVASAASMGGSLDAVELWHHPEPGVQARRVTWGDRVV